MPTAPRPATPRRWVFPRTVINKREADRRVRLAEESYKKQGYSPASAEAEAETDFQLADAIRRRRRFPKNLKLTQN